MLIGKSVADYLALLSTRLAIYLMSRTQRIVQWVALLVADCAVTAYISMLGLVLALFLAEMYFKVVTPLFKVVFPHVRFVEIPWNDLGVVGVRILANPVAFTRSVVTTPSTLPVIVSAYVTSIWLWLYAGSGFLLKAARRFDLGFDWFNRKFDIEKKPLQSIGLVAGALVAVVYWAALIVSRVVG